MPHIVHLTTVHRPFNIRIFHKESRTLAQAGYEVTSLAPADFEEQIRDGLMVLGLPRPRSRWECPKVRRELLRQNIRFNTII